MGELGDAFTFDRYIAALQSAAAMDPAGTKLVETGVLGALGIGALILFVVMFVRRSGTAAAGFALLMLTALSQAMVFGVLDFITPSTRILIGALNASALLLFVNAVLHTGRENILIAGFSALVIAGLLGLGAATMAGWDLASEARLAMAGTSAVAAALLIFALTRDLSGKLFLAGSILLSVLASILMTDPVVPVLRDLAPVTLPSVLVASGVLLATLGAPFLADEMRMPSRSERRAAATPGYMPTSLFADDSADEPAPQRRGGRSLFGGRAEASHEPRPVSLFPADDPAPALDTSFEPQAELPPPSFEAQQNDEAPRGYEHGEAHSGDPVSNYWRQDPHAVLQAEADEYVWDALAQPEVRCGADVLAAFGAQRSEDLPLEGVRERLAPASLAAFDDEVLGGGEPSSGSFEVPLETHDARFVLRGRRKVDHEGILMRVDAEIAEIAPITASPAQLAAPAASAAALPRHAGPVVKLGDRSLSGLDVRADDPSSEDSWREAIMSAGGLLKGLMEGDVRGAFALIDASTLDVRPGVIASAVGKAVRVHELPRGAMVVGLSCPAKNELRDLVTRADDIRKAGGGIALMLDGAGAKPLKGFDPDMVWLSALDVPLGRRSRKTQLDAVHKRFGVPIVMRDLQSAEEEDTARAEGALFGVGTAFSDVDLPRAVLADAQGFDQPGGAMSALRAKGLR